MSTKNFNIWMLSLLVVSFFTDFYFLISITLTIVVLLKTISKFGNGILLMEVIFLHSCITMLIAPMLGYLVYNNSSRLAVIWVKVMPISVDEYYGYFLPGMISFFLGCNLFFGKKSNVDEGENIAKIVNNLYVKLKGSLNLGVILSTIGIAFQFINNLTPAFGYIGSLCYFLIFPGFLYLYFTKNSKIKYFFIFIDIAVIVSDAINLAMFTIIIYMGAVLFSVVFIGRKIRLGVKVLALVVALFSVIIIQLIKSRLRAGVGVTNTYVIAENIEDVDLFSETAFFPMYTRLNQGWLSALVLKRFPAQQEFDGGEKLFTSVLSSFIPRFFWPDKPISGGKFNAKYYLGLTITGYSMNVGPPGEAYGSFGRWGGILYMFAFGLFIRAFYRGLLFFANKNPLYLLWLPFLFFQVMYCIENDTMQALNSLVKGAMFMLILGKVFPAFFKIKEKN